MTQLAALTLTKAQLDQIPAGERLFYFMAGQLHNDINILTNLLSVAMNEVMLVKEEPKRSASIAQVLLLLKLTAGQLYEGHKMIDETFSAKGFRTRYKDEMSATTFDSLNKMNRYFGGKSAIQRIRKKFAFHLTHSQSLPHLRARRPTSHRWSTSPPDVRLTTFSTRQRRSA